MSRKNDPNPNDQDDYDVDADGDAQDDDYVRYDVFEMQDRLWIRAITPILQLRRPDADENVRVQFAFDRLQVAACERLARILACDLPELED